MTLFGDKFMWGTATASYQVEGGITNNWTSKNDAGQAVDHYNRYKEDIKLVKDMKNNSYRFSIEWARIEPIQGVWNQTEIHHYKQLISYLYDQKIEPIITMYHFTLPIWFPGWDKSESIKYFVRYAELLLHEFSNVKYWITINEPIIYALVSFLLGEWTPWKRNILTFNKVVKNLAKAHCTIYNKNSNSNIQIGFAKNMIYFRSVSYGLGWVKWRWNTWWFELIKNSYDFIGLNYYLPLDLKWSDLWKASTSYFKDTKITFNRSDLGWEIYPKGLLENLKMLKKYNKPIIITENGIADKDDIKRKNFIHNHLKQIEKALKLDINVIGYFYWTLMDNFEWEKGTDPKFGLIKIDYENNLARIPRPSFFYYRDIITKKLLL